MANIINGTDTGSGGLITTGDSSDELQLQTAEVARVTLTNTAVVVNESGADVDFRVEGDTDANLLFVDAGNDKVGISTNAPVAKLDVSFGDYQNAGALRIGADIGADTNRTTNTRKFGAITTPHYDNAEANLCVVAMDSQSATNSILNIGGGSGSFNSPKSIVFLTSSDGASAGTEAAQFNSSGNLVFPNGQGIDFSASAGGGATSSLLDDYEEGTWTPTLPNGGTLNVLSARYVKIGQQVTASFYVSLVAPTNNGSVFQIGGLPYASIALSPSLYYGGSFAYMGDSNLSGWMPVTGAALTYIYFHVPGASPIRTNAEYLTAASGSSDDIIITITYITAT